MTHSESSSTAVPRLKRNILVVAPAWVGDMVMAQSLFKALRRQANTEVDAIVPTSTKDLIERIPEIREYYELKAGHGKLQIAERWHLGRSLRQVYQQAIVLPGSLKSALIPWFAKIPIRTGYLGEHRYGLLNDIRSLEKNEQPLCVQRYVNLALPNEKIDFDDIVKPRLVVDPTKQQATLKRLILKLTRPVIAICPGAEYGPAKRWPAEYFRDVARHQINAGWQAWIFGSNKDHEIAQTVVSDLGKYAINLAGRTTLGEAVDLMALADQVISNDSGLMHVAAALDRKLIALYGSSSSDFTPPLNDKHRLLATDLPCRPCFKRTCPFGHLDCLRSIKPNQVLATIQCMQSTRLCDVRQTRPV